MKELFDKISPIFLNFQNEKYIEIEMRLGKINRGTFDTNVGQQMFKKVLRGLKKYQGWEKVSKINDVAYYKDNIRLIIDDDSEESVQVIKQNLVKTDYSLDNKQFDVRFAVSKEIPCTNEVDEYTNARKRTRESFIRKDLSIDMTIISGNPSDLDSEEENSFQIEFEIIDPSKIHDKNTLYNIIYKIQDVLLLLGPLMK